MNEKNEFFQPDHEFSKLVKKARRKSLLRSILISITVTVLFIGGLLWFGTYRMDQQVAEANVSDGVWQFVKGANVESNGSMVTNIPFSKTVTTERNKEIAGVVIPWGQHVRTFSIFGNSPAVQASTLSRSQNTKDGRNTLYFQGERVVEFYYPTGTYPSLPDDRKILDEIPKHQVVEMAFSFDQPYTINEVRKKFLDQLAWYWVDTASPSEKSEAKEPISGNDAYGFTSRIEEMNEDAAERFIQQVEWLRKEGEQQVAQRLYDGLTDSGKTELSPENLKITGVVVTGTVEELKKFNEESMIRAAVLGATANSY